MTRDRVLAGLGAAGAAVVVHGRWVRPRLLRWGATDEEVTGPFPGAGLVPGGERSGAMAVTVDAPPERVWPWLVQMGWDRGLVLLGPPGQRRAPERAGGPPGVAGPRRLVVSG
ncbi:hypothetical protein [Geodermatophilus sp. SYSU D00684]